jgi:predicted O-methyltransferase YrrM
MVSHPKSLPRNCKSYVIDPSQLADDDYVSPGLELICPDACFPNMVRGDALNHPWLYLRREVGHAWYVDRRKPLMGFMSRDEANLLYNIALQFKHARILEIGCWLGWSTCHLGLGGGDVDVIDPVLADPLHRSSVEDMLAATGLESSVTLHACSSPEGVAQILGEGKGPWSLFVIDGDHEAPGPERDVEICLRHATDDAAFIFHDLASPHVAEALRLLEAKGFNILIYQTMQIMGIAWRGQIMPVRHVPDPRVAWQLPHHLVGLPVSGVEFSGYAVGHVAGLRSTIAEQSKTIMAQEAIIAEQNERLKAAGLRERLRALIARNPA